MTVSPKNLFLVTVDLSVTPDGMMGQESRTEQRLVFVRDGRPVEDLVEEYYQNVSDQTGDGYLVKSVLVHDNIW